MTLVSSCPATPGFAPHPVSLGVGAFLHPAC
jgi:hypothetical protein